MRTYIRHPTDIPIEFSRNSQPEHRLASLNVSRGGLCCRVMEAFTTGEIVYVRIPVVLPVFESPCRVAWCRSRGAVWEVGVQFLCEQDAYAARMVEQICHIESYKLDIARREGRTLSTEEAAREWIKKFADRFPPVSQFPK